MSFDCQIPYNDLPSIPPNVELETPKVLKEAIQASRALAELKGASDLIPNQILLIQAIGLQEAKSSSEIENIVTTNDQLYLAFAQSGSNIDSETKEVLFYKDALWHGYKALTEDRLLTTPLFIELVQIINKTTEGIRTLPGTKLQNPLTKQVIYTPPEGESVIRDKLSNLEKFIYTNKDLDPLVKMAIIHYQFEAIHPFSDGNGRVGRILNILYLIHEKLLDLPILYLSQYIIAHKEAYYLGLRGVTMENRWEEWILFMLIGITETATKARLCILKIQALMQKTTETIKKNLPRIYSKELVEVIFQQPYCKIRFLENAGIARRQTASFYLKELERFGILKSVKIGNEIYYIHTELYKILIQS
ncbi:MAG TPA: Fic family protein [Rhabdochlamydiaceae bacterium]|nr:Fic family protein [Rhabdochlamydiaceae bacterium]